MTDETVRSVLNQPWFCLKEIYFQVWFLNQIVETYWNVASYQIGKSSWSDNSLLILNKPGWLRTRGGLKGGARPLLFLQSQSAWLYVDAQAPPLFSLKVFTPALLKIPGSAPEKIHIYTCRPYTEFAKHSDEKCIYDPEHIHKACILICNKWSSWNL